MKQEKQKNLQRHAEHFTGSRFPLAASASISHSPLSAGVFIKKTHPISANEPHCFVSPVLMLVSANQRSALLYIHIHTHIYIFYVAFITSLPQRGNHFYDAAAALLYAREVRDVALYEDSRKEKYVCNTLSCVLLVSVVFKGIVQHYWPMSYQSIPSL